MMKYSVRPWSFYIVLLLFIGSLIFPGSALLQADPGRSPASPRESADERKEVRTGRVLVVANSQFPASLEIARAYMRARDLPPANLVTVSVDNPIEIGAGEFSSEILAPVQERLGKIGRAVDYIVITRGVPYRAGGKSTTAALMFGGLDKIQEYQGFYEQERHTDSTIPPLGMQLRPGTALITYNVEDALKLIERSQVQYDTPAEAGRFYFCEGSGPRGVRNREISSAVRMAKAQQADATRVGNYDIRNRDDVMAQFTGKQRVHMTSNRYLPGSIVDNLTSYGGYLLEETSQTSITSFVQHGACGTYGTVVEPTNIPTRWAHLSLGARYVAGFNLIDVYMQTIRDMSLGVVVGDPLMAPFAQPPRIDLDWAPAPAAMAAAAVIEVAAREGVEGEGISWLELWSNEDSRIGTITPQLPAGSRLSCSVQAGGEQIFNAEHTLAEALPLPRALIEIAQSAQRIDQLEMKPGGRYWGKLVVRVGPKALSEPDAQAAVSLKISIQGKTFSRTLPLSTRPIGGRVGVIDLSGGEARPGDAVRVTMDDHMITAQTPIRAPARAMVQLLKEELNDKHPAFGKDGEWTAKRGRQREQLWIVNRDRTSGREAPVTVYRQRTPGSQFAAELEDGRIPWRNLPVAAIGETAISPRLPTAEMKHRIQLSKEHVADGFNRFYAAAGTPAGAERLVRQDFYLNGSNENGKAGFTMNRELFELEETLKLELAPPAGLEESRAILFLNGAPAADYEPGSRTLSFQLNLPAAAPGKNEVWVEWRTEQAEPVPNHTGDTLFRTEPREFWILRPLTSEIELEEKTVVADEAGSLKLQGPYLHDEVKVEIENHTLDLKRSERFGLRWIADLPALPEGEYEIRLTGDPEKDQPAALPQSLKAEEKEEE